MRPTKIEPRALARTALVATSLALAAPPAALAADLAGVRRFRIHAPGEPATAKGFDNLRFGLTQFLDPGIAGLFAERGAVMVGFDYHLGGGWAIGLDSQNLYKDWGEASYFLSVTPIQAKYRLGVPVGGSAFLPFATAGAGPTLMGLLGGGAPRVGLGLGGTVGLGVMLQEAVAIEVTANLGQVGVVPYQGLQLRLGTAFGSLGGIPARAADGGTQGDRPYEGDRPDGGVGPVDGGRP